jgi:hypothetical protein
MPNLKLKDHLLLAVCDCLFNIFTATLHIQRMSPPCTTLERAIPWWQEKKFYFHKYWSRDSEEGIDGDLFGAVWLRNQSFIPDMISRFSLFHKSRAVLYLMFIRCSFHGDATEHAFACIVTIKNAWKYTHILSYAFLPRCLIKHSDNFILHFVKYIPHQTSREMYAWGKNNKDWQQYKL